MRKHRIFSQLSLLFLAALLVWRVGGVFHDDTESENEAQALADKAAVRRPHPLPGGGSPPEGFILPPGISQEDVEISYKETGVAVPIRVRPEAEQEQPSSNNVLPVGSPPGEYEVSPETGAVSLTRKLTDIQYSRLEPTLMMVFPADVRPGDVEISETGVIAPTQRRSKAEDWKPLPMDTLPPSVDPGDLTISPETGVATIVQQQPSPEDSRAPAPYSP